MSTRSTSKVLTEVDSVAEPIGKADPISDSQAEILPIHVALLKAQEEIFILRHAAETANTLKALEMTRVSEILQI